MTIVAIDPGKTTGVAVWLALGDDGHTFASDEMDVPAMHAYLRGMQEGRSPEEGTIYVVESFTVTQRTAQLSQQLDALKLIGAVEYMLSQFGKAPVMRPPADKRFATDAKLKHLGWYRRTEGGHANDAARHLLNFLVSIGDPFVTEKLKEMAR